MASSNEIAQIEQIDKALTSLNGKITITAGEYLKLVKTISDGNAILNTTTANTTTLVNAQKQTVQQAQQLDALNKQKLATEQKLATFDAAVYEQILRNNKALADQKKAVDDKVKASNAEEGSLVRMRQELSKLTAEYDRAGTRTRAAAEEINRLSREIGHAEEETNRHQRGVGGYRDQLGTLTSGLMNGTTSMGQFATGIASMGKALLAWFLTPVGMAVAAVATLVLAGKSLIQNAQDFQKASSELSAITGATGKDLDFMKNKARELSKESTLSATEIVSAFSRVGSAVPVLLKMPALLTEVTESAILLSESTQGKLSIEDAAIAATSAINQFKLPVEDSLKVVNALAAGSLLGSVRVNQLFESFQMGGPVMSSANMTIEQSIAALEILGERMKSGADSGTMMKTTLMAMQKAGVGFASGQFDIVDALEETKKKLEAIPDPLKRASAEADIFGKRGILGGTILLENIDRLKTLTGSIEGLVSKGTIAQDMAKVQMDNLSGDYDKFGNSWKNLLLQLEDGDGIFMGVWRGLVQGATWALNYWEAALKKVAAFMDWFRSQDTINAREEKKNAEDVLKAKVDADAKAKKLAEDKVAREQGAIEDQGKADEKAKAKALALQNKHDAAIKAARAELLLGLEADKDKESSIQQQLYIDGKIDKERYDNVLIQLEIKYLTQKAALYKDGTKEYQDIQIQLKNIAIKQMEDKNKKELQLEKDQNTAREKITDENLATVKKNAIESIKITDKKIKDEEKIEDKTNDEIKKKKEKTKEVQMQMAGDLVNGIFDIGSAKRDQELSALEKEKNAKLANKNLTEAQKAKIEEEYAKKAAAIKEKQAKADKLQAVFNIALNTAMGAMKAVAEFPLTGGMPFLAWVIAAGALNAALVMAQPIPKFAKGTKDAPGMGIFGEAGRELMSLRSGELMMANKATYFEGSKFKGAQIFSNPETEKMINMSDHMGGGRQISDDRLLNEMVSVRKAILSKPVMIFDKENRVIGHATSNSQTIYLNRLTRN